MKIKFNHLLFCLIISLSSNDIYAQFVSIPDANFITWLKTHGYSGCFNGNQLDTTCNAVVNATSISCTGAGIADISGIRYFDKLTLLQCNNNLLTSLPIFPPLLNSIDCSHNQLTSISIQSGSLKTFWCNDNVISAITALPTGLTSLLCFNNQLSSLPPMPSGLTSLWCFSNHLTSLPNLSLLPLAQLLCNSNQLTSLPVLPSTLKTLKCGSNLIASLPTLPILLEELNCSAKKINYRIWKSGQ